ncbi:ABC transporter permease/M1 family aminopeptidase [Algoriphagus sp. NG3]|uniref:ABC transporter permease/M1 family aminopeptidase n=1 Tax=Algoriphagus sp. NG3 TaxID=3097546 RepID=UPI002A7F2BC8|nr:M1 family aminopeptidase [Algoriphagus sp. NG3]WPR74560.1 M1 family aminopeptidase [Algoriphagus sp. NG3]
MFLDIFTFELRYRFSRPATYSYFGLLLVVAMLLIGFGNTPASEKVYHNAPIIIANLQLLISLFGILIASAVMGVPLYRDLEHKTGTFLFSYPISKFAYFMGRFWGSFVTLLFISLGSLIGIFLGSLLGPVFGTDALRYGPNELVNYLHPWLTLTLPNLWFAATLFFALIVFTRNIKSIYSGGIVVFIAYLLANFLANDIENKDLVQLLDPFGLNTFDYQTRYLTPFEQNNFILPLEGNLMLNRLLWSGIGLVFFIAAYFRFSFSYFFKTVQKKPEKEGTKSLAASIPQVISKGTFDNRYQWNSFLTLTKIEVQNITKDVYFRSILLGGMVFLIIDFWIGNTLYSVPNFPSTSFLMEYKTFDYNLFVFIIIVFFTGETLHRDKSSGYSVINDTFPVKDGAVIASKFSGMAFVCLLLATLPVVVGLIIQTLKGYFNYDFGVYFVDSYLISLPDYLQMVMLVFAVHLVVNNKFTGHATAIGVWVLIIILREFANYDFNLFFFSYKPSYRWSDMNGLGHFGEPLFWFNLYWTAFGIFLILFFSIFFSRGTENSFKSRLINARKKTGKKTALISYAFLLIAISSGAYIYHATVYTNTYRTSKEGEKRQVAYEKQMKQYEFIPQPKITKVNLKADLYPLERDAYFEARLELVNKSETPIDSIHFNSTELTSFEVLYNGSELPYRYPLVYEPAKFQVFGKKDERKWYKITALPQTMMPGDTLELVIKSNVINDKFPNSGFGRELVYNGSFIAGVMPDIGYSSQNELDSDEKRREYELPEKPEDLPPHDDPYGRKTLLFSDEADFIQFEATVSTIPSQVAVAPGYLQKEWIEDDRRYFHYVQDTPIQSFYSVLSAEYEILEDKTTLPGGQEIAIEIYYQKGHEYNLDRFIQSYKDGLAYFSETYGPFQFRQMRILEFPRYAGFAQSFPNTVPFAESFGWVADFSDPNSFDYVYYVTAHELAHQWWGHQITPNYTRGSNLISEALAEYSALVLSERKYGKANMKRFLKDELDSYLRGRSNESKKENAFINCNRAYQWYYKGSLILYGLRDLIGEAAIDSALYNFNAEFGMRASPPFPGSADLYRQLDAFTPDSLKYYLDDTWNKITLYDNKAEEVTATKLADGAYDVTLKFKSRKLYADSAGQESNAEYEGDYIDVGIFAADDRDENGKDRVNPIFVEKYKLKPGETTLTIRVKGEPAKAGIDPYNKLIDRIPDDNTISVTFN